MVTLLLIEPGVKVQSACDPRVCHERHVLEVEEYPTVSRSPGSRSSLQIETDIHTHAFTER